MSKSLKALVPLVLFLGLVALLFYGLGTDPRKVPSPLVGKPAPAFSLPALLDPGRTVSNADMEGKVTLLNVWFSSCVSCRAEHRELMRIAREGGVQIVGLNWKDDKEAAIQMLRQFGNPYSLIAVDEAGRVGIDWGVYGAPETFVVDPEGIIRYKQIGPIDQEVWEQTLRPLVEQIKGEDQA
jgi:cytochrome c biogenesis protein CcmG, thiol:disulfide interchange protein DsbE